jgi:hypothetical protein
MLLLEIIDIASYREFYYIINISEAQLQIDERRSWIEM